MISSKKLLASASFFTILACAVTAQAYETTSFSVALNDAGKTGTISIGESNLGDGTPSISAGGNVYNVAYQYFTPTSSGTYVFGQLHSPADSVIMLYSPTFTKTSPHVNYLENSDDGDTFGIADAALKSYVDAAIASRSCGGTPGLCPLLVSNLTAGVDYYVVVSTYWPGDSLGTASDTLSFFVIGNDAVGVGGVPPVPATTYASVVSGTPASGMATYLHGHDGSGDLSTVATYLNGLGQQGVIDALKTIFPVNASLAPQVMDRANGQTTSVLIDKVGTVLGNISAPTAASFTDGSFDTASWVLGSSNTGRSAEQPLLGFAAQTVGSAQGSDDAVYALASMPYQKFQSGSQAIWVQGVGGVTNGRADGTSLGYDATSYGFVSGYEYALNENTLIGALGSIFRSHINLDQNAGETAANTYSLGVYGQHQVNSYKFTGVVMASYGSYDSERYVSVGGITGAPQADYNGWGSSTSLQVSKLLSQGGVKLEPFASVNYTTATSQGYHEADGGVYNMDVAGDATSSLGTRAGITVQYDDALGGKLTLKARPYAGYRWELNNANTAVRLSGAASSTVLNGRDNSTPEVGFGFEASYKVSEASTVKLGLDASHTQDEDTGLIYAGYGIKF